MSHINRPTPLPMDNVSTKTSNQARQLLFMKHALKLAASSPKKPFGAVIVHTATNEILAEAVNLTDEDPILHAEIDVIHRCARLVPKVVWGSLELYTTAEPCAMCQCAIAFARIPFVCFGTSGEWLRERGWRQIGIGAEEVRRRTPWSVTTVIGGVLEAECNVLFEAARPYRGYPSPRHIQGLHG